MILCSAFFIQGSKALMPVWNSAKYLTSSLNLAHSLLISASSLFNSERTVSNLLMNFLASEETFSPPLGEDLALLSLLFAAELRLLVDVLLHLHGLGHPVLRAQQLGWVLDAIKPLPALTKPVLEIGHILVED